VVPIPAGLAPEQAALLLCAGVTVYSPLKHFGLTARGLCGGILGLGGVGHMGVKVAKDGPPRDGDQLVVPEACGGDGRPGRRRVPGELRRGGHGGGRRLARLH